MGTCRYVATCTCEQAATKCFCSLLAWLLCRDSCSSPFFVFQLRSDWHRKRNETDIWYDLPRGGKWLSSYWNLLKRPKKVKFHKIKCVCPCLAFLAQHVNDVLRVYNNQQWGRPAPFYSIYKKSGKTSYFFLELLVFLYDLFTFQWIHMETTTCCWQINDRLITRGQSGGFHQLSTASPLLSSFSSSLFV